MSELPNIRPTKEMIEAAKKQANGWIYVIDAAFEKDENVPPQAILGAWKVDENGEITGDFEKNPNYVNLKNI